MRIDESLAKGLRRQETRKQWEHLDREIAEITLASERGCQRAMPTWRRTIGTFSKNARDRIFVETKHLDKQRSYYTALTWQVRSGGDAEILMYRFYAKKTRRPDIWVLARISQHGIERLLKRLNTDDLVVAMGELHPFANWLLTWGDVCHTEWPTSAKIQTEKGEARVVKENRLFVMTTWVRR